MDLFGKAKEINLITESMGDYLEENEGEGYGINDIERCRDILQRYIALLQYNKNDELKIIADIKTVVIELNELNEELDYALIETDQREDLCEFILAAAAEAGLTRQGDITEKWREW